MSRRELLDEADDDDEDEDEEPADADPDPLPVEYFVDVLEADSVRTSVPKSAHSSQTSISAPSMRTVVKDGTSLPHISH